MNVHSVAATQPALDGPDTAKLKKSAGEFEALLIGQMLKAARESGGGGWFGSDLFGDRFLGRFLSGGSGSGSGRSFFRGGFRGCRSVLGCGFRSCLCSLFSSHNQGSC